MESRRALKAMAASGLQWSGARKAISAARRWRAGGRRVLVFGYHRVCNDFESERERSIESCLISRRTFARHIDFLTERFEMATMSRAVEVLSGRESAKRDLAVITFDDGYRDVLENAFPVLQAAGAPATFYISSGVVSHGRHFPHDQLFAFLQHWHRSESLLRQAAPPALRADLAEITGRPGGPRAWLHDLIRDRSPSRLEELLDQLEASAPLVRPSGQAAAIDWDGVRTLAAAGWEMGGHTTSHCVLTHLNRESVDRELRACKTAIEDELRQSIRHFAYCNGYYNDAVIASLRRAGFASGLTTEDRLNRRGHDPFRIARRILWEGSCLGSKGTSDSLLACQLDDTWSALGLSASESGRQPEPITVLYPASERKLA